MTPLTHDDIEGVYAGLRPLLAGESEQTSKLSREHAVARVAPGLVAIAGGKYTTYRVMAADADGSLIGVWSLDIAEGRIQTVRSIVNPDKLSHLGPVSGLAAMLERARRAG